MCLDLFKQDALRLIIMNYAKQGNNKAWECNVDRNYSRTSTCLFLC